MVRIALFIALALLLLGALAVAQPVFAQDAEQPGSPSGNGVQPVWVSDNPSCDELAAQFAPGADWNELRLEGGNRAPGEYPDDWEKPGNLVVTITANDGTYFDWSSNVGIDAVFVKAGRNGNLYQYDPTGFQTQNESTGDTDLHPPINPNTSQPYQISHISFCYDKGKGKEGGTKPSGKPDLVIVKRSEPSAALPGEEVTFTLEVTNQGQASTWDVIVTDEMPEYLEILEVTTTQGTVTVDGQKITVHVGVVGPGFVVEIVIRARVSDDAPAPVDLQNVAWVTDPKCGRRNSQAVTVTVPAAMLPETGGQLAFWLAYVLLGLLLTPVLLGGGLMAADGRSPERDAAR